MRKTPEKTLWIDSHHGIYMWQLFAQSFADRSIVSGVSDEDWAILEAGPDHDASSQHLDVADTVENNAIVTIDGRKYFVWQDEDIWLIPVGMEWDEDTATWEWPRWGEGKLMPDEGDAK